MVTTRLLAFAISGEPFGRNTELASDKVHDRGGNGAEVDWAKPQEAQGTELEGKPEAVRGSSPFRDVRGVGFRGCKESNHIGRGNLVGETDGPRRSGSTEKRHPT